MTTTHYPGPGEHDSATVDSVASSPRSDHNHHRVYDDTTVQARLRFMCSFGGKILPRPHDNQLRYVGGDTRIITVHRHNTTFSSLLNKLAKLSGTNTSEISVKYQLPNEDLDALITVTSDEDVENMMDEYDRLAHNHNTARLRLFLFPTDTSLSRASSISSLLDGSVKREHWFLDALNGGTSLERGRSEVSSIVSEVPDYLFGLDHQVDDPKQKTRPAVNGNASPSDPGSPAPRISSPYCSTSSSLGPATIPPVPNLRPVRTRLDNSAPPVTEPVTTENFTETSDPSILKQTDYTGQPMYYIRRTASPASMPEMPVYYMPNPNSMPLESGPVQSIPVRPQYAPQFRPQMGPGQMHPHQAPNMGQMYEGANQPVYYGPRYVGVPGYPGVVFTSGEEKKQPGSDAKVGRAS